MRISAKKVKGIWMYMEFFEADEGFTSEDVAGTSGTRI